MPSLDEILENFTLFSDWEERYQYIIDLGKQLQNLDEAFKTEAFKVRGCTSQVWLVPETDEDGNLVFRADSDALIVRGLITILLSAYNGKKPEEILILPIDSIFEELGLENNLSPNRRNGFFAMTEKIKAYAQAASV